MRCSCWSVPLLALVLFSIHSLILAATDLPEFALKDPADAAYTHRALLERGAVLLVTIPNVKHGDVQSRYVKHLKANLPPDGPRLVIVEDLSQSSVRGMALRSIRSRYQPGASTLLLLDEEGGLRRALRVPGDETAVLVFDQEGRLVQRVTGWTTADEVVDAARKIVHTAQALAEKARPEGTPTVAEK